MSKDKRQINFYISTGLIEKVKEESEKQHRNVSNMLEVILEYYFESIKEKAIDLQR
jgi:hypothetical protein